MNRRTLITTAAMLALSATTAFAQAGGKPMKITLNFLAAAPNAGFMMAKQLGLYEKAGFAPEYQSVVYVRSVDPR